MFKALLLDLDDTLLINNMETFVPEYFLALTQYVAHLVPPDRLVSALMKGMQAMEANDGTGPSNENAFESVFYPALGQDAGSLKPILYRFYDEEFPKLRPHTEPAPDARRLVEWAFGRKLQVAIATNPVFPPVAIEQRLAWAGVPVDEFEYTLVTSFENSHALKPHPAYYKEILSSLGRTPEECLMVGDDWQRDIAPCASLGIPVYWISSTSNPPPDESIVLFGRGSLSDLWRLAESGSL